MKESNQSESLPSEPQTTYRWRYADQVAHEEATTRKKARIGVLIYAAVLAAAFLFSFAILVAVLIWGGLNV